MRKAINQFGGKFGNITTTGVIFQHANNNKKISTKN